MTKIKKISSLNLIKLTKIVQILLVLIAVAAVTKGADYLSVLPLLLAALLEVYVPKDYSWGFSGRKNLFFSNTSILVENTVIFVVLIVLSIIITTML